MLGALVLAAGCGGTMLMPTPNLYALTPDNPFPDVPPCFRKNTVDVLYATDRAPESDIAENPRYGYRRSRSLAFGMTTVRIGKDVPWDALVAASRSALRPTDLPMGTDETRELGRFPPTPSKTVERNGQMVDAPEVAEARRAAEDRIAGSWNWSRAYFYHHPAVSSDLILLLRDNRRPGAQYGRPLAGEGGPVWRVDKDYPAPAQGTNK
jgi:hypothetical protein